MANLRNLKKEIADVSLGKQANVCTAFSVCSSARKEDAGEEYEEGMQEYADKAGADLDTYKEQVGEDVLKDAILRDKVLDYLVDNCVQVEQSDKN